MHSGPEIVIHQTVDTSEHWWCNEAIMFTVKNGKGTIHFICSEEDENYEYDSQLLLEGKPIFQMHNPVCGTCAGMLATGYGIENLECPELKTAREYLNSEYTNITDAAHKLKPLLGLLKDGEYLLADTMCFPSDGNGNFFYNVPNKMKFDPASCDSYYVSDFISSVDGCPLYLYPTQSANLIQDNRIDEYINLFENSNNPPRALALHSVGFVSALLDGHHKACAAAKLGQMLNCITIIPRGGFVVDKTRAWKYPLYAGIKVVECLIPHDNIYLPVEHNKELKEKLPEFRLTGRKFDDYKSDYPSIHDIAMIMTSKYEFGNVTFESLITSIHDYSEETDLKLSYAMKYLAFFKKDDAYRLASSILKSNNDILPRKRMKSALEFLVTQKNQETENLMIEYIARHNSDDENWNLVISYWEYD